MNSNNQDDVLREWHTQIITSSSLLITIPLLELTFLAANSNVPKSTFVAIAIPIIGSAIAFAICILVMIEAYERESRKGMHAMITEGTKGAPGPGEFKAAESSRNLKKWGRRAFLLGITLLIFSLIIVVIEMATGTTATVTTVTATTA